MPIEARLKVGRLKASADRRRSARTTMTSRVDAVIRELGRWTFDLFRGRSITIERRREAPGRPIKSSSRTGIGTGSKRNTGS
ncbi:MAG: hypothetical protein A2341_22445 [Deltaproteobacteria bacterium RIFOXYB12_FULL_58_9]|nr:MAG: hypothetical protein A2341_22445 [Deltaproteobacteria bacterium RIFOXYB12_FULL_58_9]